MCGISYLSRVVKFGRPGLPFTDAIAKFINVEISVRQASGYLLGKKSRICVPRQRIDAAIEVIGNFPFKTQPFCQCFVAAEAPQFRPFCREKSHI